jgi:TetR/AcrR family transcriptional regulator, transcriptional repressor for nem operon
MARTREFDPAAALEAAMKVFWRQGYYATSIEDLVEATGVSRYGLYAVYDNKRGLFLAALDHYRATVVHNLTQVLCQPDASLDAITSYIGDLGAFATKPSGRLGCLLWNTASEVAPHDTRAARKVADFRAFQASGFEIAMTNAVAKGELARGLDTARHADFLAGVAQTLAVLARSRAEPRAIANFVDVSLATLR